MLSWCKFIAKRPSGEIVFQYPFPSQFLGRYITKSLAKRSRLKKIALVHDLESLRGFKNDKRQKNQELQQLNSFDAVIVHNSAMANFLESQDLKSKIISLGIFDYLTETQVVPEKVLKNQISYAGNLVKAPFFLHYRGKTPIQLFGPNPLPKYPTNIHYMGSFSPDELASQINGKFGLVWDGDSVKGGQGLYGDYTRFNDPHKASLFLSLGIPLIVWAGAGIAEFVKEGHLGLTIESLDEIDSVISEVSDADYSKMRANAILVSRKVRQGYFTMRSIHKCERALMN